MKKTNLIILLLVPFIIALLGVVTINTTYNIIDNDIISIDWEYDETEAFKMKEGSSKNDMYLLSARGVNQQNYQAGKDNDLVWSVRNKDPNDTNVYAQIVEVGGEYYLKTLKTGEVIITCSNKKGNVTRFMNVTIYSNGAIVFQTLHRGSQNNVDSTIYYGEYDVKDNEKTQATIDFIVKASDNISLSLVKVEDKSDNIDVDLQSGKITIKSSGDAFVTLGCGDRGICDPTTYKFKIVDDGVNVYSYDDLLYCTNYSNSGEIVVLRKSFESLDNTYQLMSNGALVEKDDNIRLFGNYDQSSKKFSFDSEIYRFKTTYNKRFIDQWNTYISNNKGQNFITDDILCGLHVQKDFYGNGFTINMHNLTYPSSVIEQMNEDGTIIKFPYLSVTDLFRGPLPFYTLGDHNNMPLVEALGQDNIGMYVDGDNITINDVNLKNCDFGNMLANLNTTGTVLETNGSNITIKNSRLSNGKNVMRSFSCINVNLENSMLSNARNFLLTVGSNEYISVDNESVKEFIDETGKKHTSTAKDFLMKNGVGDNVLNKYLSAEFTDRALMKDALLVMQEIFNDEDKVAGIYKGSITVTDTYFYQSGVASIGLETMFNGPFLYSKTPSSIGTILDMLQNQDGVKLENFSATEIGGLSYPVEVNLVGKTRFYDYKDVNHFDISGLITENISKFVDSFELEDKTIKITIDDIFPIKKYLTQKAEDAGEIYSIDGKDYINIPIAYYGGGLNLSTVNMDKLDYKEEYGQKLEIDLMENYLSLPKGEGLILTMKNLMLKSVTVVTGYEPFNFICVKNNGYLFGETPKVSDLRDNIEGE